MRQVFKLPHAKSSSFWKGVAKTLQAGQELDWASAPDVAMHQWTKLLSPAAALRVLRDEPDAHSSFCKAVRLMEAELSITAGSVLPFVFRQALAIDSYFPLSNGSEQGGGVLKLLLPTARVPCQRITLTRRQLCAVLAHGFLGTLMLRDANDPDTSAEELARSTESMDMLFRCTTRPHSDEFHILTGTLSFLPIMHSSDSVSTQRVLCMLLYFAQMSKHMDAIGDEVVSFERHTLQPTPRQRPENASELPPSAQTQTQTKECPEGDKSGSVAPRQQGEKTATATATAATATAGKGEAVGQSTDQKQGEKEDMYAGFEEEGLIPPEDVVWNTPDWSTCKSRVGTVFVHGDRMEDVHPCSALVDFANRDLMIHEVIPSATQEEILFSCRPELFVSMLLIPRLRNHEAAVFRNARAFVDYTGYSFSFQVKGLLPVDPSPATEPALRRPDTCSDVVAIDAVVNFGNMQFTATALHRDINKAYVGYAGCFASPFTVPDPVGQRLEEEKQPPQEQIRPCLSSGLWGCGVSDDEGGGCARVGKRKRERERDRERERQRQRQRQRETETEKETETESVSVSMSVCTFQRQGVF